MVRVLREAGHTVTVLCLTAGEYWQTPIASLGVPVIWVGRHKSRPARVLTIVNEVRRLRPDVVQSSHFFTNVPAAIAGRVLGIPAIGALRTDGLREVAGPGKVTGLLNLRVPKFIAGNSSAGLENARRFGVPAERLFFLPNVVDSTEFRLSDRSPHDEIRLLTAGRLVEQKRHDRFLRLIAALKRCVPKPVRGIIAGDGPLRTELLRQADQLGLTDADVEFCGVREDMRALYRDGDVFVLTSDWEGTPNVVLEAMASGLPVVATDVGDTRHLVEDGVSGCLVQPDDEDVLLARVRQLITDACQRHRLASTARSVVEQRFSPASLSRNLDALHDAVRRN
jgi:glycosyltransferase involved in cell wall biosynthesis